MYEFVVLPSVDMPVTIKQALFNKNEEEQLFCFLCEEKLSQGERHLYWGVRSDKEFVQCSFHRAPTKAKVGLTVLYSYGFKDTFQAKVDGIQHFKINQVNKRDKILNPASPSWLSLTQLIELYENPSSELVEKLISENLHENRYWKEKAEEEQKFKDSTDKDGIHRGIRVLSLDRHCSNCGISEADMVAKNPKYTLCRGVCVVCYRKLFRGNSNQKKEIINA